jgi:hypothetical protein
MRRNYSYLAGEGVTWQEKVLWLFSLAGKAPWLFSLAGEGTVVKSMER